MDENNAPKEKKRCGSKVLVYLVILFAVAFLLMLFSYLMSQRNNNIAMGNLASSHAEATANAFENIDTLQKENQRLRDENIELKNDAVEAGGSIAELKDRVQELEGENESLKAENERLQVELSEATAEKAEE